MMHFHFEPVHNSTAIPMLLLPVRATKDNVPELVDYETLPDAVVADSLHYEPEAQDDASHHDHYAKNAQPAEWRYLLPALAQSLVEKCAEQFYLLPRSQRVPGCEKTYTTQDGTLYLGFNISTVPGAGGVAYYPAADCELRTSSHQEIAA